MRVFSVNGISKSGKTTTIEHVIAELTRRGYTVGSVKDIHFEAFAIDTEGTNTYRHRKAGADVVTARGLAETDILFPRRLSIGRILEFYDHDWVVLEGVKDFPVPSIACGRNLEELEKIISPATFAISGVIASSSGSIAATGEAPAICDIAAGDSTQLIAGLPAFDARTQTDQLVDLIEKRVFPVLPAVDPECCSECGRTCTEMAAAILAGDATREDCRHGDFGVTLRIGGRKIPIVPFVQEVIRRTVGGLVSTLQGYKPCEEIEISIGRRTKR